MKHLRHMMIFTRIVEVGSISNAALELELSKSVVSQHLNKLEKELGVLLLKRTTRRQVLTPVGRAFYEHCKEIAAKSQQAWDEARAGQKEPSGMISITAPHAFIEPIISPAVAALLQRFGAITPSIYANDRQVHLLEENIDLAIRVGSLEQSEYRQRLLGSFRDVLCASPAFIEENGLSQNRFLEEPELTSSLNYIANEWQGKVIQNKLVHRESNASLELHFRPNRFSNSVGSVIALAKAGAGVALIPDFHFETQRRDGSLLALFPDFHLPEVPVYSLHAFGGNPPSTVTWTIDLIKEEMSRLQKDKGHKSRE